MRILITGANGFVGKNLCASLESIRSGKDRTRPELNVEQVQQKLLSLQYIRDELDAQGIAY